MDNNMDLSSLVSLIMQNPDIIAKIASLAKQPTSEPEASMPQDTAEAVTEAVPEEAEPPTDIKRKNRERLFGALRPYLSSERAKTLASVEAMVAIIDSMKV